MCHGRTLRTRNCRSCTPTHTYDNRVNRENPKFQKKNCIGFNSSVVECSYVKREARDSSPWFGLYFSIILVTPTCSLFTTQ